MPLRNLDEGVTPDRALPEPQRPYRWDFGKQFRALAKAAGSQNARIHDLRHAGATILMTLGVPDPIVRKVTGHRSRELERYQHLTPELRALTVNLIATELFRAKRARKENGTPTGTVRGRRVSEKFGERQHPERSGMLAGRVGRFSQLDELAGLESRKSLAISEVTLGQSEPAGETPTTGTAASRKCPFGRFVGTTRHHVSVDANTSPRMPGQEFRSWHARHTGRRISCRDSAVGRRVAERRSPPAPCTGPRFPGQRPHPSICRRRHHSKTLSFNAASTETSIDPRLGQR